MTTNSPEQKLREKGWQRYAFLDGAEYWRTGDGWRTQSEALAILEREEQGDECLGSGSRNNNLSASGGGPGVPSLDNDPLKLAAAAPVAHNESAPERWLRNWRGKEMAWLEDSETSRVATVQMLEAYAREYASSCNAALQAEILRLKLQYTVAECWWEDGDKRRDSPEEHAEEHELKAGDQFDLTASTYWEERFRVVKVPDDTNDDYECEEISRKREEFEVYSAIKAERDRLRSDLRTAQLECDDRTAERDRLKEALRESRELVKSLTRAEISATVGREKALDDIQKHQNR